MINYVLGLFTGFIGCKTSVLSFFIDSLFYKTFLFQPALAPHGPAPLKRYANPLGFIARINWRTKTWKIC